MTRGQRTLHQVVWLVLAPLLAALLLVAVVHRSDASSRRPTAVAAAPARVPAATAAPTPAAAPGGRP